MKPLEYVTLKPMPQPRDAFDEVERKIKHAFRLKVYFPLIKLIGYTSKMVTNAAEPSLQPLSTALFSGRLTFNRGTFSGHFDAHTSRILKQLGARWDHRTSTFKLHLAELPFDVRGIISASESRFTQKLQDIDAQLRQVLPTELSDSINFSESFDKTIWKMDKLFRENVKRVSFVPELSGTERKKIADDWQENLRLYIRKFTDEEIKNLRGKVRTATFEGDRYGSLIKMVQRSYGVTANKAKFLARQETKLLTSTLQEARYAEAGIDEYKWHCVAGSNEHPVRPRHKALSDASEKGQIFRFSNPPVTTEPGEPERRNNPGKDFNCRCQAIPVVRFKK
jgi:SPP1 gp7 family putative phage head morphogenesis protein